jgi:DNA-binding CsgD family transcriptional regulator
MLAMVLHRTARRVPYEYLGRFVGGSIALATGLMFLLSLARGFAPLAPLASAAAFGATAWLLWADRPLPAMERPALPRLRTTGNFPLLAAVAVLLSLAYGVNDSTSYLRFEELLDAFGLSRLTLGAGLLLAGHLADRRREYLPLAAVLGGAATMIFHAMTLEGFPPAVLFYANEFFWSFSLLFILIVFMEASLRTTRPELWAGMGRLIEMPAEGLGAALGTAMMATLPTSAILTAYTLALAAAAGLLYHELLSHVESTRFPLPTPPQLCPAIEAVAETEACAEAEEDTATTCAPTSEDLLASWRERYALTNRETEILRASLSDDTAANIGKSLFISTSTVRFHLTHLLKKTGVSSRKELIEIFERELNGEQER